MVESVGRARQSSGASRGRAVSRNWIVLLCLALAWVAMGGCKHDPAPTQSGTDPKAKELPALTLKDDTASLLLTWVDDLGDFHVGQRVSEVPAASRKQVRVVITTRSDGTGEQVYVANLDAKRGDGTYPVQTMSRA